MKTETTILTVKFFANLRQPAGVHEAKIEVPSGLTIGQFKLELIKTFPKLENNMSVAMASINHVYSEEHVIVPDGALIALFPPVSGG